MPRVGRAAPAGRGRVTRLIRALVTNDDGIDAPGLGVLAAAALGAGWDVVVAAPVRESSGTSASLVAVQDGESAPMEQRILPELAGIPAYAVGAHPGFIVLAAMHGAYGPPPDVVLSGVNHGANVGRAILHSGTVGAALTGSLHGARSMAVSLAVRTELRQPPHWETAAAVVRAMLPLLAELAEGSALNVNVPDLPLSGLGALVRRPLARAGITQTRIEHIERFGRRQLQRVAVPLSDNPEPDTDLAALAAGHPTISEIQSVEDVLHPLLPEPLPPVR